MFKAKLIEDKDYYKVRRKLLLLMLPTSTFILLLWMFLDFIIPTWLEFTLMGICFLSLIALYKNHKLLSSILKKKQLELDEQQIRITSKKGIQEIIDLDTIDKLFVKNEYVIIQEDIESIKEFSEVLTAKERENYIIIEQENQKRKLNFEVDTFYMIEQLKKVIASWEAKGYEVERLSVG